MGARESGLWTYLRDADMSLEMDLRRVENVIENGTPDVEGIVHGRAPFHIELKRCDRPARPMTSLRVKWQPGQVEWLHRRWIMGGLCWVLLAVGQGAQRRIYLIRGDLAGCIRMGQPEEWYKRHSSVGMFAPKASAVLLAASNPDLNPVALIHV